MKQLKRDLDSVLKSLKMLTRKVEKMQSGLQVPGQTKASKTKPAKKAATQKPKKEVTAYETFLGIINRSKKGVTVEQLKAKTGFNVKKIANLVYKAGKQGKIKSAEKGVYVKA